MADERVLYGIAPVKTYIKKTSLSQGFAHSRSSVTYLDHDHRERENVGFLAAWPLVQDLWRSPSRGVTILTRCTPYGIQVQSHLGEAEIRDACMTRVIHEDICLI